MAKFKKGDKVIVTDNSSMFKLGDIGTIDEDDSDCPWCIVDGEKWAIAEHKAELYEEQDMNRLKGLKLKFDVRDNPELSAAIQKRLFDLGGGWTSLSIVQYTDKGYLYSHGGSLSYGRTEDCFVGHANTLTTLDDLYHLPEPRTITLNGKTIELSEESYQAFKAQFK